MPRSNRLSAIEALIAGSVVASSPKSINIYHEIDAVLRSNKVPGNRGALLHVLHTTRVLDTTLQEFLQQRAIPAPVPPNLRAYLNKLTNHGAAGVGTLPTSRRDHYKHSIVDKRNLYMHQADTFPSKVEADRLLAEMHACVAEVLRL